MTQQARSLRTPRIEARTFASGDTARASQPGALAELATDAASGHPGQRMTLPRMTTSGVIETLWAPTAVPRWLRVTALIASSDFPGATGVTLELEVTDGSTSVASSEPEIPAGLKGDIIHRSGYSTSHPSRLGAGAWQTWYLDVDALVAKGLSLSADAWRFTWTVGMSSPSELELVAVEEVPRFLIDDAEAFGQVGESAYLPRGLVIDGDPEGLPRLLVTTRAALMLGIRTYHCLARPQADPWVISSTSFTTFGASDEEASGVAARSIVRPRRMRGTTTPCRVRFALVYKLAGASPGDTASVKLTSGYGGATAVLTDTSGSWVVSPWETAYLDTSGTDGLDAIYFQAKVSNGSSTLSVIARPVIDDPEA